MKISKLIKNRIFLVALLVFCFFMVPSTALGAVWAQNIGLLSGTSIVFPSDTPAIDKFMAAALKPIYGNRIQIATGTNTTGTDQVALLAAVVATPNHGDIFIAPGNLYFSAPLTLTTAHNDHLVRGVEGASFLHLLDGVNNNLVELNGTSNFTFEGVVFDQNGPHQSSNNAIQINSSHDVRLRNCDITYAYSQGVLNVDSWNTSILDCRFKSNNTSDIIDKTSYGTIIRGCRLGPTTGGLGFEAVLHLVSDISPIIEQNFINEGLYSIEANNSTAPIINSNVLYHPSRYAMTSSNDTVGGIIGFNEAIGASYGNNGTYDGFKWDGTGVTMIANKLRGDGGYLMNVGIRDNYPGQGIGGNQILYNTVNDTATADYSYWTQNTTVVKIAGNTTIMPSLNVSVIVSPVIFSSPTSPQIRFNGVNSTTIATIRSDGYLTLQAGGVVDYITLNAGMVDIFATSGIRMRGATQNKIVPISGQVIGLSTVSTALTIGTQGSIIIPSANMSGAATNATRDALAGNVDGAIAVDNGTSPKLWIRSGGGWYSVNLNP